MLWLIFLGLASRVDSTTLALDVSWTSAKVSGDFGGIANATALCHAEKPGWIANVDSISKRATGYENHILRDVYGRILRRSSFDLDVFKYHMMLTPDGLPNLSGNYASLSQAPVWGGTEEDCLGWSTTHSIGTIWDVIRSPFQSERVSFANVQCFSQLSFLCYSGWHVVSDEDTALPEMNWTSTLAVTHGTHDADFSGLSGANDYCTQQANDGNDWLAILYLNGVISPYLEAEPERVRLLDSNGHVIHPNISLAEVPFYGLDLKGTTVPYFNGSVPEGPREVWRGEDHEACLEDDGNTYTYRRDLASCSCEQWSNNNGEPTHTSPLNYSPLFRGEPWFDTRIKACHRQVHVLCVSKPKVIAVPTSTPEPLDTTNYLIPLFIGVGAAVLLSLIVVGLSFIIWKKRPSAELDMELD